MKSGVFGSSVERRTDRIVTGLSEMAAKAQDIMKEAGATAEDTFGHTKSRLIDAGTAVSGTAHQAARVTDAYVRENPWKVLGVAAAVGALVAILLTRR